jgi:hypothetical protein
VTYPDSPCLARGACGAIAAWKPHRLLAMNEPRLQARPSLKGSRRSLLPLRPMFAGDASVGAFVRPALSHGWRTPLGITVETQRNRRIEEAVAQDADEERAGDVSQHCTNTCGIGNVAG